MDILANTWAVLVCVLMIALPAELQAQQAKVAAVEGASFNDNSSMADNLKSLLGNKVVVTLDSGKAFAGIVKEVGKHLVHLEKRRVRNTLTPSSQLKILVP